MLKIPAMARASGGLASNFLERQVALAIVRLLTPLYLYPTTTTTER